MKSQLDTVDFFPPSLSSLPREMPPSLIKVQTTRVLCCSPTLLPKLQHQKLWL